MSENPMRVALLAGLLALAAAPLAAQENYEIQVYGSETVPRGLTMVEIHSNFTTSGLVVQNAVLYGVTGNGAAFSGRLQLPDTAYVQ